MRSTKARMLLENLEGRALLTTFAEFNFYGGDSPTQVVPDTVGTVNVSPVLTSTDANPPAENVTLTTIGLTAVPGVDYTPVQQTITLEYGSTPQVSVPILPGPASLGSRTLEVAISPTHDAPQGQVEYIVIQHGTDTTLPTVVGSQALTRNGKVVAFSLQFSKPMAIGPAADPANYAIADPNSTKINKVTHRVGHINTIPLKSAIYDSATETVYLVPAKKLKPSSHYLISDPASLRTFQQIASETPKNFQPQFNGISNLTDNSGNPIGIDASAGGFTTRPAVAKAGASVLSDLFGTHVPAAPKGKPKPGHKAK